MGYANQFIGGGDGRERRQAARDAGAAGVIVADLTPDEGGPFEAVARRRTASRSSTSSRRRRRPDRRAEIAGAERRVPVLRVARRRDRRARDRCPSVGRLVRDVVAASPVPVGVGFGVSRPAHVRAIAKAGGRRRDRRVGARRRARRGRPGRRTDGAAVERSGGDRHPADDAGAEVGRWPSASRPPKKAFATAVDWPGWSRSGKTEELRSRHWWPTRSDTRRSRELARRTSRRSGVDRRRRADRGRRRDRFGVPDVTDQDRRPRDREDGERLARWSKRPGRPSTDRRRGARGAAQGTARRRPRPRRSSTTSSARRQAYAHEMGIKRKEFTSDRAARRRLRAAMLEDLRAPSDGSPIADRKWTTRYAAHRIAWHALDHAWEIEDRSEPEG